MKYLFVTTLLVFTVIGCSPTPRSDKSDSNVVAQKITTSPGKTGIGSSATEAPLIDDENPESKPVAITVNPPMLPILTAVPSEGWQSFTSVNLGVTVNYPLDWSVTEQTDSVIFTSPQGGKIQLQAITTNSDNTGFGNNNQQCATLINSYGLSVDTCVDTNTYIYSALFSLHSDMSSSQQWLLLTTGKDTMDIYLHMLDSLHPIQ